MKGEAEKLLEKPARVNHTIFRVGVPERLVVECAQRHYEWHMQHPDVARGAPTMTIGDLDAIRRGEPIAEVRLPLQGRSESRFWKLVKSLMRSGPARMTHKHTRDQGEI